MHIDDRGSDTPGDDPSRAPLVWHDPRNVVLAAAFAELHRRRNELKKCRERKPFWKRWYVYAPVWLLMLATANMPKLAVTFGLTGVFFCLIMDFLLPWRAKQRLQAFTLEIRKGAFGHEVMWEDEPVWEILTAALQPYEIRLTELFRDDELNKKITPPLADLLNNTWITRSKLRVRGSIARHDHPSMVALANRVSSAAKTISVIYRVHVNNPR